MRGLVFTEFLDFVDQTAGPEMVEDMIAACDLASGGAYTTVGNYPHDEFLTMLAFLHRATGQNVSEMVMGFGENLFGPLIACHPKILHNGVGLLDFLESIETHIHHEVRKLTRRLNCRILPPSAWIRPGCGWTIGQQGRLRILPKG